jgi:DNA segregation ATPase FtsK/SpoIIIE-like protein
MSCYFCGHPNTGKRCGECGVKVPDQSDSIDLPDNVSRYMNIFARRYFSSDFKLDEFNERGTDDRPSPRERLMISHSISESIIRVLGPQKKLINELGSVTLYFNKRIPQAIAGGYTHIKFRLTNQTNEHLKVSLIWDDKHTADNDRDIDESVFIPPKGCEQLGIDYTFRGAGRRSISDVSVIVENDYGDAIRFTTNTPSFEIKDPRTSTVVNQTTNFHGEVRVLSQNNTGISAELGSIDAEWEVLPLTFEPDRAGLNSILALLNRSQGQSKFVIGKRADAMNHSGRVYEAEEHHAFDVRSTSKPANQENLPSLDLIETITPGRSTVDYGELEHLGDRLETVLKTYGIEAVVKEIQPGPVITRFEIELALGEKVSRIINVESDLARTLAIPTIRVVEVIPGKPYVGIEIQNTLREMVDLRSLLESPEYQQANSSLPIVLGKGVSGECVVASLEKMPHLLVAGTSGSGKSVAINVMLLSLLYKSTPDEVRLILIDPKMIELSIYQGIPHLLRSVITDVHEAIESLTWCVEEMERRFSLLASMGVRNIEGYNQKIQLALNAGLSVSSAFQEQAKLPYIIVIIDEFADLMMVAGKIVETQVERIAQKAKAAGIHLILATQRPYADVITGRIKSNIPTRIAFKVASAVDSITILDQSGAETLLGNGDMLYLSPGSQSLIRAHGSFVTDDDVGKVVEFLRRSGGLNYIPYWDRSASTVGGPEIDQYDELYEEAVRFVTESRKGSISSVQRRFKIGYNRAAKIIDHMEMAGIVGPAESNGSRAVLAPSPLNGQHGI